MLTVLFCCSSNDSSGTIALCYYMNNSKSRVTDALVLVASLELAVLLVSLVSLVPQKISHKLILRDIIDIAGILVPQISHRLLREISLT